MERNNYYIKKCTLKECILDTIYKYELGIKNIEKVNSHHDKIVELKKLGIDSGLCKYFSERHIYYKYDLEKRLFQSGFIPDHYIFMPPVRSITTEEIFSCLIVRVNFLKKWLKDLDKKS
jgi:hypothetical protein